MLKSQLNDGPVRIKTGSPIDQRWVLKVNPNL